MLGVVAVEDRRGSGRRSCGRGARAAASRASSASCSAVERHARPPAKTSSRRPRSRRGSVVSSSATPTRAVGVGAQVDAPRAGSREDRGRRRPVECAPAGCRRTASVPASRPRRRRPAARSDGQARARGARSRAGPRARGRRRTCWPSPRAAPARCRCCSWPCRAGCAARGSAAPGGRRAGPRRPARRRRAGPGIVALVARRCVARKAACGPPKPIGTPKRCAEPTRDVGPELARRARAGSGRGGRRPPRAARPRRGRARRARA